MHAIDDIDVIKTHGYLRYYRFFGPAKSNTQDNDPVESVVVQLNTPNDPDGRCVGLVTIEWVSRFCNGALSPVLVAEGSNAKMLALFPELLTPFFEMKSGELAPEALIVALSKIGITSGEPDKAFVSHTVKCCDCASLFPSQLCTSPGPKAHSFRCDYCAISADLAEVGITRE